jgi:hypothetical protein
MTFRLSDLVISLRSVASSQQRPQRRYGPILRKGHKRKRSDHCRFTSLLSERLAHKACLTGGPESPDGQRRRLDPWGDDRSKLASGRQLSNGALHHKDIRLKLELTLR